MKQVGATVFVTHFTAETCRNYQCDLAGRGLKSNTIRVRLATLGSFGKWAVRRDKLLRNPLDQSDAPASQNTGAPAVPTWKTVKTLLKQCTVRERAILALMAYGGLRRGEVVALDVGDVASDFGLRRGHGQGRSRGAGHLAGAGSGHPPRVSGHRASGRDRHGAALHGHVQRQSGQGVERRISGQRLWKLVKAVGTQGGIPALHPHAFRHACAVELPRRTKNLRVVQEHLRHEDVQTTTGYTRITQQDVQQALETFDNDGE
jgi:integrase/recombinase XerC